MKRIPLLLATLALLFSALPAAAADFPKGSPKFKTDFDEAKKASKSSGKPLLVVFSASWCGPCQANKKRVYPDTAVKPFHDKFVWVYLDTDEKENAKVAQEYKVTGIPHIEFIATDGKSIDKAIGGTTPAAFSKKLGQVLAAAKTK